MKKLRYIIIGLIIIIIVIISILLYIAISKNKSKEENIIEDEGEVISENPIYLPVESVENVYETLKANNIANQLISNVNSESPNKTLVLSILNEDYINENSLNDSNILNNLNSLNGIESDYMINEIYKKELAQYQSAKGMIYYLSGTAIKNNEVIDIYFCIREDYINNAFDIRLVNKEELESLKNNNDNEFEIKQNEYNEIVNEANMNYQICYLFIRDYINYINNMPEEAFNKLDEDYKNIKFNNDYNSFLTYINNNTNRFENLTIQEYTEEQIDGKTRYTILDTNDNYYVVILQNGFDYKIMLDNYTTNNEQYQNVYEQASDEEKVNTNILKFIRLINEKDYNNAYALLDEQYRNNNFKSLEDFENYIKENFWNNNIATVNSIENVSGTFVCDVQIKSGNGLSAEEMNKQFIVKLLEGTDFVMSFEK